MPTPSLTVHLAQSVSTRVVRPRHSQLGFGGGFVVVDWVEPGTERLKFTVVVGFARTDDGHNHRQGAACGFNSPRPCRFVAVFAMFVHLSSSEPLSMLKKLVNYLDPPLHDHLCSCSMEPGMDWLFCHRWLLLDFKREFALEEIAILWERIWAQHSTHSFQILIAWAILEVPPPHLSFEMGGGGVLAGRQAYSVLRAMGSVRADAPPPSFSFSFFLSQSSTP